MIEFLNIIIHNQLFRDFIDEAARRLQDIDWETMGKVCSVMVISMLLVSLLVLINDRMYESSMKRRMKIHHLTIRNDGNSASVYLLHTVDLPKTLAIRFRIDIFRICQNLFLIELHGAVPDGSQLFTIQRRNTALRFRQEKISCLVSISEPFQHLYSHGVHGRIALPLRDNT